jgi:hypothetical protein
MNITYQLIADDSQPDRTSNVFCVAFAYVDCSTCGLSLLRSTPMKFLICDSAYEDESVNNGRSFLNAAKMKNKQEQY